MRIHHAALPCHDLTAAIAWYARTVGLTSTWETTDVSTETRSRIPGIVRMAELHKASVRLHLYETQDLTGGVDGQHCCLAVDDTAELEGIRTAVCEATGHHPEIQRDADGVQSIYFSDPDGNEIEVAVIPVGVDR